jgi:hypothetical protein
MWQSGGNLRHSAHSNVSTAANGRSAHIMRQRNQNFPVNAALAAALALLAAFNSSCTLLISICG